VGPLVFGHRRFSNNGLIAVGDALGMIDPFTGTGIQTAVRSGELIAECVVAAVKSRRRSDIHTSDVLAAYSDRCRREFRRRLRVAGLLRTVAFSPFAANLAGRVMHRSPKLVRRILRQTR
jgi:flavin-dependent dehydrogenase